MNYFDGWSELTRKAREESARRRERAEAILRLEDRFEASAKANLFAIRQKVERLEKESGDGHKE